MMIKVNEKKYYDFVKSHNLINRIFDMLDYFYFFGSIENYSIDELKYEIRNSLKTLVGIEAHAKYFEDMLMKHKKDIEIRCNLTDLITDLDYLKQYVTDEQESYL